MASPRRSTKPTYADQPPRRERRLVSRQKLADYLAVSDRTITNMLADGRLRGYRLGRTVRFDLNEIDDAPVPVRRWECLGMRPHKWRGRPGRHVQERHSSPSPQHHQRATADSSAPDTTAAVTR